tara:strand:- start:150 stop:773 length:624 start_codon:yes stop_codon:yes gene_type:complete
MRPQVHSLFPTPIFQSEIPLKEGWLEHVKTLDYDRTAMDNGYISRDRDIFSHPELRSLKHEVSDAVRYFAYGQLKVCDYVYIDVCRAWGIKHMPNDWAQNHCHMNSIFSGIYYLDVTEHSGDLVIEKGQHSTNCFMTTLTPDVNYFNQYTQQSWRLKPETGMLVVFPSQIIHNVEKNLTQNERYAIAFDVFVRGKFGEHGGSDVTIK